jgi:hypothetical protein
LQTAYWPSWGAIPGSTSMDFLRGLTDGLNYAERPDGVQGKFDTQITEIAFFHNLCVVRKGDNLEPSNAPDLVAAERLGNVAASQGGARSESSACHAGGIISGWALSSERCQWRGATTTFSMFGLSQAPHQEKLLLAMM